MAKKVVQGKKMKLLNVSEKGLENSKSFRKEVKFEIDKNAFSGPFKCHGINTKLVSKKLSVDDNVFSYDVWICPKCGKEYLDTKQSKRLEDIWTVEKLLKDDAMSMERSVNFDGKMFFIRFPKELTKKWKKGQHADIKFVDSNRFIIEVKC